MFSLDWPYAQGKPLATATFKCRPEDFQVTEFFDEEFSGHGEHIVLKIEKRGLTTEDVVKSLSRMINKPTKLISYAGLKDRQALTTQWLSVHAPGEEIPGIESLEAPGWKVIDCTRHHKKIKPGFLAGNHFVIRLQNLTKAQDLVHRIEHIAITGVPNYFGEQRFGRAGNNLIRAEEVLTKRVKVKDRFLKGLYYSAARSWLFNLILAKRVQAANWNQLIAGDVVQLSGSKSIFIIDEADPVLLKRLQEKDIAPASPLPGKGKAIAKLKALDLINEIYAEWLPWLEGLTQQGLEEAWRANILHIEALKYTIDGTNAQLSFTLPAGAYATTVLRELVVY
jgi:tRNA pseudouridine13 synthase